ncbi:unnamed protein product [Closterium sp. Naga37s-1]|nr:unnamed protein product [Closterium sp. Naga37s-1]
MNGTGLVGSSPSLRPARPPLALSDWLGPSNPPLPMADDAPSLQQPLTGNSSTPRKKRAWSIVDFLVQFRWILVIFVVLPVSFAFQCNKDFWDWWSNRKSFAQREREHQAAVQKLVNRLKSRDRRRDGLVCTSRKPWLSVSMRNSDYKRVRRFEVDMNEFCQILAVDTVNRIARCEPYVGMGQLSAVTVPLGYALEVVPELDDLTVGGLINGYGIEGSSHIYGLFQPTRNDSQLPFRRPPRRFHLPRRTRWRRTRLCWRTARWCLASQLRIPLPPFPRPSALPLPPPPFPPPRRVASNSPQDTVDAYEIVLADGTLVRATRDNEHADLFYAIPWSQGTLGLLVAAEIRLIPVKEFMRVTYTPVRGTLREMTQAYIDSFCPRDGDQDNPDKVPDFVEGMVYTRSEGVMMTGRRGEGDCGQSALVLVPLYKVADALELNEREFEVYPIWLCPHRLFKHPMRQMINPQPGFASTCTRHPFLSIPLFAPPRIIPPSVYPIWLCPHRLFNHPMRQMINPEPGFWDHRRQGDTAAAQMFTDIGLYYAPGAVMRGEEFDGVAAVQRMEKWLIENASFQALYAVTELNERDFWRMFDASLYAACREKYQAVGTFMSVYYKSKKGRKTEAEVMQEERKEKERVGGNACGAVGTFKNVACKSRKGLGWNARYAVGTFMSVYYNSKKGRKTEAEVMQEERKEKERVGGNACGAVGTFKNVACKSRKGLGWSECNAVGMFMGMACKSKKGRKTEAEVMQEERKEKEVAIAESA